MNPDTSKFIIRKAKPTDLDALVELENICFTHDKMSRQSYRSLLNKNSAEILAVESNNKIIGSAAIFFRKSSNQARLYSIAIHPGHRQAGIANALREAMEKTILSRQCTAITLEVHKNNIAAINFYKKHGYELIGTYSNYYEDGGDALRMKKNLL